MTEELATIITSATASTIVVGTLGFLCRSWISERLKNAIKHEYDAKLEIQRAQLKSEADSTLERLRAELQIAAAERNVRFSGTFERMLDTVAETFAKLLAFRDAVADYVNPVGFKDDLPLADRRKIVASKYHEFLDYFRPRRLFLPRSTADAIEKFQRKMNQVAVKFMVGVEQGFDERKHGKTDTWGETMDIMGKEVPPLLDALEDDFRRILGILDAESKPLARNQAS